MYPIKVYTFILLFQMIPILLFGQSVKLTDREDYFFRQNDSPILPMEDEIGFLEEREEYLEPFISYIKNGPDDTNSVISNRQLLIKKYELLLIKGDQILILRVSPREAEDTIYSARFLIEEGFIKNKGTLFLQKKANTWLLYDLEIEDQEISNP